VRVANSETEPNSKLRKLTFMDSQPTPSPDTLNRRHYLCSPSVDFRPTVDRKVLLVVGLLKPADGRCSEDPSFRLGPLGADYWAKHSLSCFRRVGCVWYVKLGD